MLIAEFTSRIPTMGQTKTYEDWSKYIGQNPHRIGVVARMYPNNTLNFLTDGLRNIYYNKESVSKYQSMDALSFEWTIENNQIKHIAFAEAPEGDGVQNNGEIKMVFEENYYQKFDIFRIDGSKQQCQVLSRPIRRSDHKWEVTVRLISNNYDTLLDVSACQPGMTTTWQSTANVEMSEEGYSKFQSSFEKHRNYMTYFRHDVSWSSLYARQEEVFIRIADDKDKAKSDGVFKMHRKEKELLDTFMYSTNTGLLLNKGNVDKTGRPTISEPDTNRPIYIGQGLIPQIEEAANKFVYVGKPTIQLFHMIMGTLTEKAQEDTGNKFTFVVNRRLWEDINLVLGAYLADYKTDGTYMYSKSANKGEGGYIKVGATFDTYQFAGNQIQFVVDRTLSREYPDKGYGICIDLTADKTSGTPAIAKFALQGKDVITSKIVGVEGYDGRTSGEVSSNVAASTLVMSTYAGVACFTPFRSAIIYEA